MDDNTLLIIILVCVGLFLFSFLILYFGKVKKFFSWLWGGVIKFFSLFKRKNKKEKPKVDNKKGEKVVKSGIQTRPLLLPKSGDKKELELSPAEEKLVQNQAFKLSQNNKMKEFEKQKEELKNFVMQSEDNDVKVYNDITHANEVIEVKDFEDDDEDARILKKLQENSTVNVDGEDIDLNRLPLQIRRLLLSGILDRKEDD